MGRVCFAGLLSREGSKVGGRRHLREPNRRQENISGGDSLRPLTVSTDPCQG